MSFLKKAGKILLYITAGLIGLLFLAGIFIDPIARRLLEKQVAKAAEGQYSLELNELDISILRGDVQLNGVRFTTDSSDSGAPPIVFLTADKISIEDVKWLTYLLDNKLVVDRVFLDNMNGWLFAKTAAKNTQDTDNSQKPFKLEQLDVYPAIKKQIDRFHLKDLGVKKASFTLVNRTSGDTLSAKAAEFNFQTDNILIDADKLITNSRAFYSTAINFNAHNLQVDRSGNKRMATKAELIRFVTEENLLSIQTNKIQFLREPLIGNDTLLFASLGEFQLRKLDLNKVQKENTAAIEKVSLNQLKLINKMPASPASVGSTDTASNRHLKGLASLSLGSLLPELIEQLELEVLVLAKVNVRQGDSIRIEEANFQAREIVINKQAAFAKNRFLHATRVKSRIKRISASFGNPTAHIGLAGFQMEVKEGVGSLGFKELQIEQEARQIDQLGIRGKVGPFKVVGLDTRRIPDRQLTIDSIGIYTPKLVLHLPKKKLKAPDLYPFIEEALDELQFRKIAVINADINVKEVGGQDFGLHIPAVYLQMHDTKIAEGTAYAEPRVLHARDIALRAENLSYRMPDSIYFAQLDLFRLSTFEEFMVARDFRLDYEGKAAQLADSLTIGLVYKLRNALFRLDGIRFSKMIREKGVFIESVKALGFNAFVYQNGDFTAQRESPETTKPSGMPQEMLRQLETPLHLGSIAFASGHVAFEQMKPGADTAGFIEVSDLFFNAENITNQQSLLRKDPEIKVAAGGMVYGAGAIKTELVIHMHSDSNLVLISGKVDTLDLTKLNRFAVYTSPVAFSSGQLYMMDWNIRADEEKATGKLAMMYEDVKIRLGESSSSDTTGVFKEIGSFLINSLALEEDVPADNPEEPETAEISNERNKDKGFINYYITSMIDGLTEIVITIF